MSKFVATIAVITLAFACRVYANPDVLVLTDPTTDKIASSIAQNNLATPQLATPQLNAAMSTAEITDPTGQRPKTGLIALIDAVGRVVRIRVEGGVDHMAKVKDDTYVQYNLPGHPYKLGFDTFTWAAGLNFKISKHIEANVEYGDLGYKKIHALIINDAPYFACRDAPSTCPLPKTDWHSGGHEYELMATVDYVIQLHNVLFLDNPELVFTVGVNRNKPEWELNISSIATAGSPAKSLANYESWGVPTYGEIAGL